ncbi:MAG TPA: amidohydrolase family protein [Gaiellales bacterium]|nr:amidohydrolase family protein [Gaiellales bacterium]
MPADLILRGATVHTVDAARRTAAAVAIENGRIAAVGDDCGMDALRGPATRVVDLDGAMILPGFQDAHCHLGEAGHARTLCSLEDSRDADEHLRRIAAYSDAHPERDWIVGGGWSMSDFPGGTPTAAALDTVVPDRPAVLTNRDIHGVWANSRALEAAGITAATPDPPGGRIERDEHGAPMGTLQEQAMGLVLDLAPAPTHADRMAGIRAGVEYYHRLGITACQDARVDADWQAAYEGLARSGELRLRVRCALEWEMGRGEEQVGELVERRRSGTVGRLASGTVKFFHDGVVENRTAAMLDPYLDAAGRPTAEHGLHMYDQADLERFVRLCDAEGFGVHIHTIGDRAVRDSLDVFEAAARANGRRDARHQLAHVQFAHADDLPRFRALGVIANVTPLWARLEAYVAEMTLPFVSARAGAGMYPFASIVRAGGALAFGSDWAVSTPDPRQQLALAIARRDPLGDAEGPFLPDERLDLGTAIAAQTIGAAHACGIDVQTGSIEPGKLADLVVLDRDLFATAPAEYLDVRVLATLIEGEVVHAAPGSALAG